MRFVEHFFGGFASLIILSHHAAASTAGPKYGGIFLADQRLNALYLLRDLNGNGDAEGENEFNLYFDAEGTLGNPFDAHTGKSGFTYVTCGDNDAVYRLEDINHDGDAQDEGESTVWFSKDNAEGFTLPTPNGVFEADDGAVYIVNAGTGSQPLDAVYRTVDLDGDGSANGKGESSVWIDLSVLVSELLDTDNVGISSAFDIVFIGDTAYIIDSAGGNPMILAAKDTNKNGVIDSGELVIYLKDNTFGVSDLFSALTKNDGEVVTMPFMENPPSLYFMKNKNGQNIASADEVKVVWDGENQPTLKRVSINFGIAAAQVGTEIYTASNDSRGGVFRLVDIDGDGKYNSEGEVITFRSIDGSGETPANRPRNVEVLPEFFQAKGYYGVSNVDNMNDLPFDSVAIANLLDSSKNFNLNNVLLESSILQIYVTGVEFRTKPPTLQLFAEGGLPDFEKVFKSEIEYNEGKSNFIDLFLLGVITGTNGFENVPPEVRYAAVIPGIMSLYSYYVRYELRMSKLQADNGDFGCKSGAPHSWDKSMALFYGPRGRGGLYSLFEALEKAKGMRTNSATCEPYLLIDPDEAIVSAFTKGIAEIAPNRPPLGSDECASPDTASYPLESAAEIEVVLYRTFLVALAGSSREIAASGDATETLQNTFQTGALYMAVGPGVALLSEKTDALIKEQFFTLSNNPCSNVIPGAILADTFDKLIAQLDDPTPAPTPSPTSPPTLAPTNDPTSPPTTEEPVVTDYYNYIPKKSKKKAAKKNKRMRV